MSRAARARDPREARYWSLIEERYGPLDRLDAERARPAPAVHIAVHTTADNIDPRPAANPRPRKQQPRDDAGINALRRAGALYRAKNPAEEASD